MSAEDISSSLLLMPCRLPRRLQRIQKELRERRQKEPKSGCENGNEGSDRRVVFQINAKNERPFEPL